MSNLTAGVTPCADPHFEGLGCELDEISIHYQNIQLYHVHITLLHPRSATALQKAIGEMPFLENRGESNQICLKPSSQSFHVTTLQYKATTGIGASIQMLLKKLFGPN